MSHAHAPVAVAGTLSTMHHSIASDSIVCEGWVLKKRRKKMQGFARRYFTLYQSGLLSYSFEPGQPVRDQVTLHNAAITTAPGRKDIHIDSNTATFHIKCLSGDDFNMWMAACRKFIYLSAEARKSATVRLPTRHASQSISLIKSGAVVDEMGSTIKSLEMALHTLALDLPTSSKKNHSFGKKTDKDKNRDSTKEPNRFGLFKRSSNQSSSYPSEFGVDGAVTDTGPHEPLPASFHRIQLALETLKAQHGMLLSSIQILTENPTNHGSPVPTTVAEEMQPSRFDSSPRISTPVSRVSKRTSTATSGSESVEWYDAPDVAEEFVMDAPNPEEPSSRTLMNESQTSLSEQDFSSIDTDIEDHGVTGEPRPSTSSAQVVHPQDMYRTELPSPPVGDEGSLFAILKKNVGKDLSTITFPVTFNEPLTLLQRAAEEVEYYSVLDDAALADNSIDRMCCVAAFAVSSYTHTRHRTGRKAFNPMLGETFEDPRMKFIAEKVRHNPLEMAYHAEGKNWQLTATSSGKTKFWGKSLEIIPLGSTHLTIGQDHYVWKKPSSFMRNLMVGTKYLEHTGKMTIENIHDQTRCILEFKQNSYWGPSNVVSGVVYGSSGDVYMHLEGRWDDQMTQTLDSSNFRILWRATPFPKNTHGFYGFTSFGITLNELTDGLVGKIPPTDSRFRPDVRALEEGHVDIAEAQKLRVEEMQRERRKQGKDCRPRWFYQDGDEWTYAGGYWEARERGWKGETIESLW